MLTTYAPIEFAEFLMREKRPILAGYLDHDTLFDDQMGMLQHIAQVFEKQFSVCLLSPEHHSEFSRKYAIAGTPSFILFYLGEEKTRFLGYADALNLMNILLVDEYSELDQLAPQHSELNSMVHPVPCVSGTLRTWKG